MEDNKSADTAKENAELNSEGNKIISNALELVWSFGINKNVPALNVSNASRKAIFYVTAHTGVLYDFDNNVQSLYQGHCNAISCSCVSNDKRWLATSDVGQNCMLIVWDTDSGIPIRTLFDVDSEGIIAIAISGDAKYIATLNVQHPQTLSIWDWTTENDSPIASMILKNITDPQTYIAFNNEDSHQVVTNNGSQVIFYLWSEGEIEHHAPSLTDKDFNKTVGAYSQSVFKPLSDQALTATSCGNIVVWVGATGSRICDKKPFKIVKIQEKAISVLTLSNESIVIGDVDGTVKFLDPNLKIVNWYNELGCTGTLNSVSFTYDARSHGEKSKKNLYPESSTLNGSPFISPDFTVSTSRAGFLYFKTEGSEVQYIKQEHEKDVQAIACHPKGPYIATAGFDGLLQVSDYEAKMLTHTRLFSNSCSRITCITYNHTGDYLALGFDNGTVQVIDSVTLENEGSKEYPAMFHHSHDSITKIAFSNKSEYLACCDLDRCVVVFKSNQGNKQQPWEFLGKHRAHYKEIQDLMFIKALDEDRPRLMTVGRDRVLVEYDLVNSGIDDLQLVSSTRIEQDAVPISIASYPPVVKEDFILVANDQYKLKLFNSTTKMCRQTLLGPTYGTPIQRMVMLPSIEGTPNRYMAYTTTDKVGLNILPLDGNPHKTMALIAHPGEVHNLACSFNGNYVFTAGGADTCVLMWKVNINALEATAALGGDGLVPFYSLLEGGRDGELFAELEEYFYYSQIRSQGVDSMASRSVSTDIPLSEIPFVMRALGFYPTEQQIEEMINEVKFSEYVNRGLYLTSIDLGTLIKLYVNHRPVFGLQTDELVNVFNTLGYTDEMGEDAIDRADLFHMLQDKGEHLTESELADCIQMLAGGYSESDTSEEEHVMPTQTIQDYLPEKITADVFASDVLGFTYDE